MNAIAQVLNQMQRLLLRSSSNKKPTPEVFDMIHFMTTEAVSGVGSTAFMEKRIVLTPFKAFEAVSETPSSRSKIEPRSTDSPAKYLLSLILGVQEGCDSLDYRNAMKTIMEIHLKSMSARRSKLSTLRNLTSIFLSGDDGAFGLQARCVLWELVAGAAISAIGLPANSENHNACPIYPGHEYRDATKILEIGFHQRSSSLLASWQRLFGSLSKTIEAEIGSGAVVLLMTEPLASMMCKEAVKYCDDSDVNVAMAILGTVRWPLSQHQMERARTQLWGTVQAHQKPVSENPLQKVYEMVDLVLNRMYLFPKQVSSEVKCAMMKSVILLLRSCPFSLRVECLTRIQGGLATWLQDRQGEMIDTSSNLYSEVSASGFDKVLHG